MLFFFSRCFDDHRKSDSHYRLSRFSSVSYTHLDVYKRQVKVNRNEVELSEELLTSFAKFLVPEIRKFYQSEEGKAYYEKWLKKHPEYALSLIHI